MKAVQYVAIRRDGSVCRGRLDADSLGEATGVLAEQGLHPMRVWLADAPDTHGRISRRELATLFRSLASLTDAGVPLDRAVLSTGRAMRGRVSEMMPVVEAGLRRGLGLAGALERQGGAVPPVVLRMLHAGERAGRLPSTLEEIANHLEQEAELAGRIQSALAYPAILLATGFVSVGVISFVILPRFVHLLGDLGQAPPPSTRLLLAIAGTLRAISPVLPLVIALGALVTSLLLRSSRVRHKVLELVLGLPAVGELRHTLVAARWLRAFSAALGSGMAVLPALDGAGEAAGDLAIRSRTAQARDRIAEGESPSAALESAGVLPAALLPVVAIGDSSGRLALMAGRAASLAASDGERRLRQLVGLLEPLLILFFGGVVAFVAAALLQAVYALRPGA